jgi:hypothetical protein
MNDERDVERRLQRVRPSGPSAAFDARILSALEDAEARRVRPSAFRRHAFALAASLLLVVSVALLLAGRIETSRVRSGFASPATILGENEQWLEEQVGPEALAFQRQLQAARAAARPPRDPMTVSPLAPEEYQ